MSSAAMSVSRALRLPSVSNWRRIFDGSLKTFTDFTSYASANLRQFLQSVRSSTVTSSFPGRRIWSGHGGSFSARASHPLPPPLQRDRDEPEAVGDDLIEERRDALVLLPVLRADRPEMELHVLDRHLRDVREQRPPDRVHDRRVRIVEPEGQARVLLREDLHVHLHPP